MNIAPKLEVRAAQPYAAIPIKAPLKEWDKVNALVPEVFGWLARRGIVPAGPLFYRYRVIGDRERPFDLEVGVPVADPVEGDGRIVPGAIAEGTYATVVHEGHPDRLTETFDALQGWADAHGVTWHNHREEGQEIWGGRFEFYLTDPVVEPDLGKWSTEVAYQVA